MDYFDSLLILSRQIDSVERKTSGTERNTKLPLLQDYKKQITDAIGMLKSLKLTEPNSPSGKPTQEEINSIKELIGAVEQHLSIKSVDLLKNEFKSASVSSALYHRDWKGIIDYDKVRQIPSFQVRGRTYLTDGEKVDSHGCLFCLRGIQIISPDAFQYNVATQEWCGLPKYPQDNEWLILNYLVPGEMPVQVVALFSATLEAKEIIRNTNLQFDSSQAIHTANRTMQGMSHEKKAMIKLLKSFWRGDTDYCNERFKMIPNIVEGSWAITLAVGQKPVILGKKLDLQYHKGPNYFEVDIDISSSVIATRILGLVRGVSRDMVVDLGVTIQGESEDELPEVILAQARFDRVDLEAATPLNDHPTAKNGHSNKSQHSVSSHSSTKSSGSY